jgi:hypothetical protein
MDYNDVDWVRWGADRAYRERVLDLVIMPDLLRKGLVRDMGVRRDGKIVWKHVPMDDLTQAQRAEYADILRWRSAS